MVDLAQDLTAQIKVLEGSAILPIFMLIKNTFAYDTPTVFNDLTDDVHSAKTLACFRKKAKILSSLQ